MSVRIEQVCLFIEKPSTGAALKENVNPTAPFSSPSNCMVVKSDIIPASPHSFPGMEHARTIFNAPSQETPSNGISQLIGSSESFDDEREIEAAAAASEPVQCVIQKSVLSIESPTTEGSILIPSDVPPPVSSNHTLPPLHINVNDNECSKIESSSMNSRGSEFSSNGSLNRRKVFQQPSLKIPQRAGTSTAAPPIVMGPPSNTNTQVLLSPAGNLHNGYQRVSSGDASPSSVGLSSRSKISKQAHPLALTRSPSSQPHRNNSVFGGQLSRPPSSLASPSSNGRKDHEMTRRRVLVDRITKSRGPDYVHLLPQTEGLSNTQTSILIRKHRGTLISEGMPYSLQKLIDCGPEPDRSKGSLVKAVTDANKKRKTHTELDDITDVSDIEEDEEGLNADCQDRKSPKNLPRWAPKRMRFSGMLAKTEALLEEKISLMGMLHNQEIVMNCSSGVRFVGEEMIPRRRRQLNGMYYLYDKASMRRTTVGRNGCSRTMPIQSWTNRKLQKDIFETTSSDNTQNSGPAVLKPSSNPNERWIATSQYSAVSHLTNGEKRELTEYNYEEYRAGEGIQRVNELSSMDPVNYIVSSDFTPFEDRQMAYIYRLSSAPSSIIRKKHGKSIYFEADNRKTSEQSFTSKKKSDKKKERKPLEEESSDEERVEETREPAKKRPRGRPATTKRKPSRMSVAAKLDAGIYLDYLFEDYLNEDICTKQLPNKITYASIVVPQWFKIPAEYWEGVPSSKEASDDLLITVAKQHHKLMHAERDRIKKECDKRVRNRSAASKSAAATPAHNPFNEHGGDNDGFPPFDMSQFEPGVITSRRLYASVEKPYEQRDFLKNNESQSSK